MNYTSPIDCEHMYLKPLISFYIFIKITLQKSFFSHSMIWHLLDVRSVRYLESENTPADFQLSQTLQFVDRHIAEL